MRTKIAAALLAAATLGSTCASPSASAASSSIAWKTPNLSAGFTPQGMTYWVRSGPNMIIMAEYKLGSNTRLVAVDLRNGSTYGQVSIAENHSGGIAIVGGWLFVQDQPHAASEAIRRYNIPLVKQSFDVSHKAKGHPVYVKQVGSPQQLKDWQYASFMTADGDQLLSGHYNNNVEGSRMYRYDVDQKNGTLTVVDYAPGIPFAIVPLYTQGVTMFGEVPVYASHLLLTFGAEQLAVPDHAEGLVVLKGVAYVAFEGKAKYVLKFQL